MTMLRSNLLRVELPSEVIQLIGWNLDLKNLLKCTLISRVWRQAIQFNDAFWKLLYQRDFTFISQEYEKLYREFYKIRLSFPIKPQPITLKELKSHNPQLTCIYTGKTATFPQFTPLAEIGDGKAIKNLYKKVSKKPQKTEKWVGKIGDPIMSVLRNDPHTLRTRAKIEMDIDSLREKLAFDLYQELGRGLFLVPKTRISSQPIVNSFTENHGLIPSWVSKYPDCLRIMSCFMSGYQNLNHARVMENVSLLEFIHAHHCFPDKILTEQGASVPFLGLSSVLSLNQILTQEPLPKRIGWIWIRDQDHRVVKAQAIKVESPSNSILGIQDLSQALTPEKSTFRNFVKTHRRFPDKILTPQGHPVILRGKNQLPKESLENPQILELTEGRFGFLWIEEIYQGKSYIESAQIIKIDPTSQAIEGFHPLSEARHDLSFLDYMELYHRPPETILSPAGHLVPLKGMMALLAVARILGDVDVIGGGGGNAGFRWEEDASHNIIGARVVKIDPGFCFGFTEDLHLYNWTLKKQKGSPFPADFRDLQPATQKEDLLIQWSALSSLQKQEFLATLLNTTRYLKFPQVFEFLFHREGRWTRSELESLPDYFLAEKQTQLRLWTDEQLAIYKEELEAFKRFHPEYLLRCYYVDQCSEISLPMTKETFSIRELYTNLKIVQKQDSQPDSTDVDLDQILDEALRNFNVNQFSSDYSSTPATPLPDLPVTDHKIDVDLDKILDEAFEGFEASKEFDKTRSHPSVTPLQFFNSETPHKVLIVGKAGSGKSTLCQKIAHDWASGQLWKKEFEVVYWIPLRSLNQKKGEFKDSNLWLAEVISHLLLKKDEIDQDIVLEQVRKCRSKSLWILDGYDEATPELQAWIAQLLQEKDLTILLTSRPGLTEAISPWIDIQVDNAGFSDDQIEKYTEQFFAGNPDQNGHRLFLEKLRSEPRLYEIAHIPLQLQMLCSLWNKDKLASSLTTLYGQMISEMLSWNDKKRTLSKSEDLLGALGKIAETTLKNRQFVIPKQIIEEALKGTRVPIDHLVDTGLIKESSKALYEFHQLDFQEYLAADFLSKLPPDALKESILFYRQDPKYHLTLIFLCGLIYQQDPKNINLFFEAFCKDDLTWSSYEKGVYLKLGLKCLNECSLKPLDPPLTIPPFNRMLDQQLPALNELFLMDNSLYLLTYALKYLYTKYPSLLILRYTFPDKTSDGFPLPDGYELFHLLGICLNNLELFKWLYSLDRSLLNTTLNLHGFLPIHAAARNGNLEFVKWACSVDPMQPFQIASWSSTPFEVANFHEKTEVAEWLRTHFPQACEEQKGCTIL